MYCLITLTSVTAAKRVEKIAKDKGLYCVSMHAPKMIAEHGCGYCVKVKCENAETIYDICIKLGLKVPGIFKEINENGRINYARADVK